MYFSLILIFEKYIETLIDAKLPNLKTIRVGTKSLSYWPYKFLTDDDSELMMEERNVPLNFSF